MAKTTPQPDLDTPAIGGLLRMVWQLHRDRMYERLVAAGYPNVTRAQFALLRYPGVDGMRPSEAADLAGLSKQTVNDLLGERNKPVISNASHIPPTAAGASSDSPPAANDSRPPPT